MNRFSWSWPRSLRQLVRLHLQRLQDFFVHLGQGLRDRLAAAAGEAVAGIFRALLEANELPYQPDGWHRYHERETPSWRDEIEESWREDYREVHVECESTARAAEQSRWRRSLAAAFQAASWWLRAPATGLPTKLAIAASLAASLAAAAGVPLTTALALASAIPGLIALADAARDSVAVLARQELP
jgi:hypothetical protein